MLLDEKDIKLSENLTVRVKDLTARDARKAEAFSKPPLALSAPEARAYVAITAVSIDGGEYSSKIGPTNLPINDAFGVEAIDGLLNQRTRDALVNEYATAYILTAEQVEALKNA